MRGQVLGVDRVSGEGQISGEDGLRYTFTPADWSDSKGPAVGVRIDFATEGTRALRIFRLPELGAEPARRQPPANDRNKYVAVLLAFFFGIFGIHRFYLGRNGTGVLMIVLSITIIGLVVTGIWALIDTIRYLLMSDAEFAHRYARHPGR
jgi:TM2 domain-containing membrane protein YozV